MMTAQRAGYIRVGIRARASTRVNSGDRPNARPRDDAGGAAAVSSAGDYRTP